MVKMCKAPECTRPVGKHGARGYCPTHYNRLMRGMDLAGRPQLSQDDRFRKFFTEGSSDECWPWTGGCDQDGYGKIWSTAANRSISAHRYSWELANGKPVPETLWVLHHCDNPPCVNPAHLYLGDAAQNNQDRISRGRWRGNPDPWACRRRLTAEQVQEIRDFGNPYYGAKAELARRYGVSHQHIRAIQLGIRRSTASESAP
jgi:hypothetical protein